MAQTTSIDLLSQTTKPPTGPVSSVTLLTGGANYTAVPTVAFTGGNGGNSGGQGNYAAATAVLANLGGVAKLTLGNVGAGYTSTPTVTISTPNSNTGTQATATATLSTLGSLNTGAYNVLATGGLPGVFTSTNKANISNAIFTGSGANANISNVFYGVLSNVVISNGGSGYVANTILSVNPEAYPGLPATFLISTVDGNGAITALTPTQVDANSSGGNYTQTQVLPSTLTANSANLTTSGLIVYYSNSANAPGNSVSLTNVFMGIQSILIDNGGSNYSGGAITIPPTTSSNVFSNAIVYANLLKTVSNLTITNSGSGYSSAPTVTISAPTIPSAGNATATANATLGYAVANLVLTNGGEGYQNPPTVSIVNANTDTTGSGATANAQTVISVVGDKVQAASFLTPNRTQQTISWSYSHNCNAYIKIQASLETNPTTESEWSTVYWANAVPLSGNGSQNNTGYYNLKGSYVWLRAVVTDMIEGDVQFIKVSY